MPEGGSFHISSPKSKNTYESWLKDHLAEAKAYYEELSRLDDQEQASGGSSEYYEKAHQMFGYVAALEKCLRELKTPSGGNKPGGPAGKQ